MRGAIVGALLLLLGGCAEGSGYHEWEGTFFTLVTHESTDIRPCGGQVAFTDRVIDSTGSSWAGSEAVRVDGIVELRVQEEDGRVGAARAGGFAWAAAQRAYVHEVGHVVTSATDGSSVPVFSEGVAQLIGNSGWNYYRPLPPVESFAFLDRPEFGGREYEYSQTLLAFLARRYGVAAVRDAYQRADPSSGPQEIEDVFVEVFGDAIYDDFDEVEENGSCAVFFWECSDAGPPITLPFDVQVDPASCADDEGVFGFTSPSSDEWWPFMHGTLTLETPRRLGITLDNAWFRREACEQQECLGLELESPRAKDSFSSMSGAALIESDTAAGRHMVRISPVDPQLPFSATIVDLGPVE